MLPKNVTSRSVVALAVVAISFALIVLVARYGADAFLNVRAAKTAGAFPHMSAWLVQYLGAGLWALLVLPMAWGAIVYFNERTPDLLMRFVGTLALAASTSALVGLKDPGSVWAGHVGRAMAGTLASLSGPLGGFGTVLAWLIVLALFGASGLFATDWMFHTLRRGGAPAETTSSEIATEPQVAALLDDPADAEPRGFISASAPRIAEPADEPVQAQAEPAAAYDLEHTLETEDEYEIHTTLDVRTPDGWDETVEDGRRIIAAPSGYRGVEFLPPSDELATPEVLVRTMPQVEAQPTHLVAAPGAFHDDEFVATSDAAFFVEHVDPAEAAAAPEETSAREEESEEVDEAVQALFEAVTAPEPAAPASGIGLPPDSPFLDEFFPGEASWPFAAEPAAAPSDGASAASEMATDYASAAPAAPAEPPAAPEPEPAFADDVVSMDEILVSRLPSAAFDDSMPVAAEEPLTPAPRAPEPVAEATYSSEPSYAPERSFAEATERVDAVAVAVADPVVETAAPVFEPEPVAYVEVAEPVIEAAPAEAPAAEVTAVEAVAEPVAPPAPVVGVAPQLDLFAAVLPADAIAPAPSSAAPEPDLARIHAMELDPLFRDAVVAVLDRGRASAVVLQRQLGIGYARGIRILDQMTAAGLVGPDSPTGSRQLRITREKWDSFASA
jgi:hypothetical protein